MLGGVSFDIVGRDRRLYIGICRVIVRNVMRQVVCLLLA